MKKSSQMNKVISIIVLIVCSLGATGAWAQYYLDMDGMAKNTFCVQAKRAFGMTYYDLCEALGYEGYSLEKMQTIVNNARNKYGNCISSQYPTLAISSLKQTSDIYCEKGNIYVGFAKQNSLKAYEKAFDAEVKAIQKEQEREAAEAEVLQKKLEELVREANENSKAFRKEQEHEAAENAKAFQEALQKADSIEQAKIQAVMKDYSVDKREAKEILKKINTFTDERDKQEYKIAKIGNQTWMAENLNYNAKGSKCYDNKPENCDKYGRLYDWQTAMKACPIGWHLPTNAEWDVIMNYVQTVNRSTYTPGTKASIAGKHLKATNGWNWDDDEGKLGNGLDSYGFAALPSGLGRSDGYFNFAGDGGIWWSASEHSANGAYNRDMGYNDEGARWYNYSKTYLHSVRCLQD